jgi:hypothetical protein
MSRFFLCICILFSSLHSVLRRHDVHDDYFRHFGLDPSFLHVGMVECSTGRGTGTLIDPRTALTAGHVTGDCKTAYFTLYNSSGVPIRVVGAEVMVHTEYHQRKYLGSNAIRENCNDLAMLRLKERITDVLPASICYLPLSQEMLCYGAGFGFTGTGLDSNWEEDNRKRGFTNILDGEYPLEGSSRYLQICFDSPENPHVTFLEGVGAFGDSGGPVFVDIEKKKEFIGVISMLTLDKCYGAKNLVIPLSDYRDWIETHRFTKHACLSGHGNNWEAAKTWQKETIPENHRFACYEVLLNTPLFLKMERPHTIDSLKIDHPNAYLQLLRPLYLCSLEISSGSLELSHDGLSLAKITVEGKAYIGGRLYIHTEGIPYESGEEILLVEAETLNGQFDFLSLDPHLKGHLVYDAKSVKLFIE